MLTTNFQRNRELFLKAANDLPIDKQIAHLGQDPDITDVVTFGNPNASRVLLLTSGMHGAELPFGSCVQRSFLNAVRPGAAFLREVYCVLGHAMNAYGARNGLRTDTDGRNLNIDPARNMMPFKEGARGQLSPVFRRVVATASVSSRLDRAMLALKILSIVPYEDMLTYLSKRPWLKSFFKTERQFFRSQVIKGQNSDPGLPFYGGAGDLCHAAKRLQEISDVHIGDLDKKAITWLDIHTGNGKRGQPFVYLTADQNREKKIKSGLSALIHSDQYAQLSAFLDDTFEDEEIDQLFFGAAKMTNVVVEFGTTTYPSFLADFDNLMATIVEAITLARPEVGDPAQMRGLNIQSFTPPDSKWRKRAERFADDFGSRLPDIVQQMV